uniref:Uncharacterized protein n=1 Tax=Mesocestoides corti TaxID=53468 RepID=A0A5K3F8J5_MESCO
MDRLMSPDFCHPISPPSLYSPCNPAPNEFFQKFPVSVPCCFSYVCLDCVSRADSEPATSGSGTSVSLESSIHHTQQSTEGSAFLDRGSVTSAIRPTHAGLACSLSSYFLPHSRLPQDTLMGLRATPTLLTAIHFFPLL